MLRQFEGNCSSVLQNHCHSRSHCSKHYSVYLTKVCILITDTCKIIGSDDFLNFMCKLEKYVQLLALISYTEQNC